MGLDNGIELKFKDSKTLLSITMKSGERLKKTIRF